MKFKSNAKYKGEPKTGSIFTLQDNSLRIVIHKYVGCGDTLFLNCSTLGIYNYDLRTEDFEEAVSKAKEIIMREVKKIREDSYRFYSDSNIEFDR
jgi:hypothetical protein|nr:MAG TPA: hypothetical protein [Caudoviricetes sp.]